MSVRIVRLLVTAAVTVMAAVTAVPGRAQPPDSALHLLDVPYLPQSEALCGGAAVAMVMRFFGETGIYAETFAGLVDRGAGGIRGQDLIDALRARGWQAQSFSGDAALVRSFLDAGRPVIALIEDRPGRFHYVVLVGWHGGRVIVHDPARAPFRLLDERAFTEAWAASASWTLVAGPPPAVAPPPSPEPASPTIGDATPLRTRCDLMVEEGVRLAGTGALDAGRSLLEVAAAACPLSAAPWREMAGIHALKSEWREAAQDARRALANDDADPLALRILATALFLDRDSDGALAAWNRLGQPTIDLVSVTGLERTRYLAVTRGMGLRPQQILTQAALQAARRRLAELPAAQSTRLTYRPGEHGTAQVEAAVLERPLVPRGLLALAALGVHAVSDRELAASLSSPSGGGELATLSWRWWEHRPRVGGRFAAPAPFGGVWAVDGFTERQSYAGFAPGQAVVVEEPRRRAAVQFANWTERGLRWEVASGLDVWGTPRHRALSLGVGLEQRLDGDRVSLRGGVDAWTGGLSTWGSRAQAEWRSATLQEGNVWLARAGIDQVAGNAPRALWAGAGTGQGRDALLRAHPLLDDGIIRDGVFGRRLLHGGVEARHWLRRGVIRLAPALFVDAARAWRGLRSAAPAGQIDAGAGLRIAVPGAGVVRVDYARGLRERAGALSIGWTR